MRRIFISALLCICTAVLFCQQKRVYEKDIDPAVETLLKRWEGLEEIQESQMEELMMLFTKLLQRPLNINRASVADLESLSILTPFEIVTICDYRKDYGAVFSINELLILPGLSPERISLLAPFISFGNPLEIKSSPSPGMRQILMRSSVVPERRVGYMPIKREDYIKNPNSRYVGNPLLIYGQLRFPVSYKTDVIVTAEKDPGEKGVDYLSWSCSVNDLPFAGKIIAGSFNARFGQGLVLWNGFVMDASWEPSDLLKKGQGISIHTSSDENSAFRGVSSVIQLGRADLTIMISSRGIDARVTPLGYTSLIKTGLHNTPVTQERKRALEAQMSALNISLPLKRLNLGLTLSADRYSHVYAGRDSLLLQKAARYGKINANWGVDWRYVKGRVLLFGEVATDISLAKAITAGCVLRITDMIDLSARYSYKEREYLSRLSVMDFASGKRPAAIEVNLSYKKYNSLGIYLRSSISQSKRFAGIRAEYKYREENSVELRSSLSPGKGMLRGDFKTKLSDALILHSRADITFYKSDGKMSTGKYLHQELIYKSKPVKTGFSIRLAWFNVPSWDNRIYSYEREMLYQYRTSVLYGNGLRFYANFRYNISQILDIWLRFASTFYVDREKTGEGLEQSIGPSRSEAKIQLRIRF